MTREVCGICWCPYQEDGTCGCEPATLSDAMRVPFRMAQAYENGYKAGAAAEREACAKVCEEYDDDRGTGETWGPRFAALIRARSKE